jgi:hypothetical protein
LERVKASMRRAVSGQRRKSNTAKRALASFTAIDPDHVQVQSPLTFRMRGSYNGLFFLSFTGFIACDATAS